MKTVLAGFAAFMIVAGSTASGPVEASARYQGQDPATMPSRAGAPGARVYRRLMRKYRTNPGAQQELRTNRQGFCQFAPSRC